MHKTQKHADMNQKLWLLVVFNLSFCHFQKLFLLKGLAEPLIKLQAFQQTQLLINSLNVPAHLVAED